jgi:hypothetical protein
MAFKPVGKNLHGIMGGYLHRAIATFGINNNNIIGKQGRLNAVGDVNFFVMGQDINGEHEY